MIERADKYGLALANIGGELDLSTPDGRTMYRIRGAISRHESEQSSRRIRRKFLERAEGGKPHGKVANGYQRVDGRDVLDPEQAAVISDAADGSSWASRCDRCDEAESRPADSHLVETVGVRNVASDPPSRSKRWTPPASGVSHRARRLGAHLRRGDPRACRGSAHGSFTSDEQRRHDLTSADRYRALRPLW